MPKREKKNCQNPEEGENTMPVPENFIDLIGTSRIKRNYDLNLLKNLETDREKIPSLVPSLLKANRILVLFNPEKEEKNVQIAIEELKREQGISYSEFDRAKYEETFSEITFGRGIINLLMRTHFLFYSEPDPKAEMMRKLIWSFSNIESYGFVNPFNAIKDSDTLIRSNFVSHIMSECKSILPPEFSSFSDEQLFEMFTKYIEEQERFLNGYSHFGKLKLISNPIAKDMVFYYNWQAIETVICNSSDLVLVTSNLSGSDFKSLFYKLRFSRANYEIYSRPWESNTILLILNRGYRLFNANDVISKYLSRLLLKNMIPSLIDKKTPFILICLMKSRNKDVIVHILPEDFENARIPESISLVYKGRDSNNIPILEGNQLYTAKQDLGQVEGDTEGEADGEEEINEELNDSEIENEEFDFQNLENIAQNELFDSEIEKEFSKSFQIYMGTQWMIEREPEIITTKSGKVMIPDFTISNGSIKIYIEIVGFWTSKYIKNKLLKISELNLEEIPPFFFLIDEDLKKYFKELTLQNNNIHFLYYKQNKMDKCVSQLKDELNKKYSTLSLHKEEIKNILLSALILDSIEKILENQAVIQEKELFNLLKIMVCENLKPKGCITAEQISDSEIERTIFGKEFQTRIFDQRNFMILKSISAISKANFKQLEDIIIGLVGNNEISESELSQHFFKVVNNSPVEPIKIVLNSEKFKIRWSSLVSKLISLKK